MVNSLEALAHSPMMLSVVVCLFVIFIFQFIRSCMYISHLLVN